MPISKSLSEKAISPSHAHSWLPGFPTARWGTPGAALYHGDVRDYLRRLPARAVHTVVTSPPYWNMRDYSICQCRRGRVQHPTSTLDGSQAGTPEMFGRPDPMCQKCGGTGHITGMETEIGKEKVADCLGWARGTPCDDCYVCHMVEVFSEVYRVLRDDGTLWLNLGDTFNGGQGMVPEAVAMALRANGWKLAQRIIWYSPNKMPESVTNRCSKSHEHIFLLTKGDDYYFDHVAIQEPAVRAGSIPRGNKKVDISRNDSDRDMTIPVSENKNKRDVWIVPTKGYPGAHFATFSSTLITPCILAGTSEAGCCAMCEKSYERIINRSYLPRTGGGDFFGRAVPPIGHEEANGKLGQHRDYPGDPIITTIGWHKVCGCTSADMVPCIVLDPFVGSGTTVATALELGRHGVGIDLSEDYLVNHAIPRIQTAMGKGVKPSVAPVIPPDIPPPPKRIL